MKTRHDMKDNGSMLVRVVLLCRFSTLMKTYITTDEIITYFAVAAHPNDANAGTFKSAAAVLQ
jgi:hypothetical protein